LYAAQVRVLELRTDPRHDSNSELMVAISIGSNVKELPQSMVVPNIILHAKIVAPDKVVR
jgi:hypothetical protein